MSTWALDAIMEELRAVNEMLVSTLTRQTQLFRYSDGTLGRLAPPTGADLFALRDRLLVELERSIEEYNRDIAPQIKAARE